MEQIVVKTEVQPNGDILLFYVDEHEHPDAGILDNESTQDESSVQMLPETKYVIEDNGEGESADELDIEQAVDEVDKEEWLEEEIRRLIIFYLDNKETFLSGTTKKKHLWAVACETMLTGKHPISCEAKLRQLKMQYAEIFNQKGLVSWPYFELCHQAFNDDETISTSGMKEESSQKVVINIPMQNVVNEDGVLVVKKVNANYQKDEKVETMLSLYIKHNVFQKNQPQRGLWEFIAREIGEEDPEFWHKRFLNFKQHYIKIVCKRKECGSENISWPYLKYFDEIFGDDEEFQKKYVGQDYKESNASVENNENYWNETETTFLVKYNFDCFHEFKDPTIPDKFLWGEVGRLLNKKPHDCTQKYEELKKAHFDKLLEGGYDIVNRIPRDILFDNILAKEVEHEITDPDKQEENIETWDVEQLDELVQFLYENMNLLKDSICYYVCWATLSRKLNRTALSCIKQWDSLTSLYKTILEDKKEDPDMQIDWRYIDLFDRIFDYGMDTNLLDGYKKQREQNKFQTQPSKIGVKKIIIKDNEDKLMELSEDEESYDERGFTVRTKKGSGDTKAFKILEYYLKNKEKFASSQQKKMALWEILSRQIGITATECAHRFRNFKQVYTKYVQREINKPEMPILWPYYMICKKVFGYRAIKSKLKNGKMDSDEIEDWSAKEIKQLINYFAQNYHEFQNSDDYKIKWKAISQELGRTENSCCEKFLELRKSYRKLKTMKAHNPDVKVSWKYFNMIDNIYNNGGQNVEVLEEMEVDDDSYQYVCKTEPQEDDEYQCIIVMPEGEDINNAQIILPENANQSEEIITEPKKITTKWNRRSKTQLLRLYLKYLKSHKGEVISPKEMWTEISMKLDEKTPVSCKKMYLKLKNQKVANEGIDTPYDSLLNKILSFKQSSNRSGINNELNITNTFEDVPMSDDKVHNALNYYLQNLEDFVSPKFEQKYLWTELAKYISEPVTTVFNKINFLKQNFNSEIETPFSEALQNIVSKENELKEAMNKDANLSAEDEESEQSWSDIETERLLTWYLAHLDKFKNPKFVRSYLWMEASDILKKSPLICSKKMSEIRSQYRTMVRENPEELDNWKFYNLCQRIYGTGKKHSSNSASENFDTHLMDAQLL